MARPTAAESSYRQRLLSDPHEWRSSGHEDDTGVDRDVVPCPEYFNPSVQWRQYTKIIIEPVMFWGDDAEETAVRSLRRGLQTLDSERMVGVRPDRPLWHLGRMVTA
jgi:hypothetical protein